CLASLSAASTRTGAQKSPAVNSATNSPLRIVRMVAPPNGVPFTRFGFPGVPGPAVGRPGSLHPDNAHSRCLPDTPENEDQAAPGPAVRPALTASSTGPPPWGRRALWPDDILLDAPALPRLQGRQGEPSFHGCPRRPGAHSHSARAVSPLGRSHADHP